MTDYPGQMFDHYSRFLRAPSGRETYAAVGAATTIQALRFKGVFPGCVVTGTIGLARPERGGLARQHEVVVASDLVADTVEALTMRSLFAAAARDIPLAVGTSLGGLGVIAPDFIAQTGKAAIYLTQPFPFPPAFEHGPESVHILLAVPISQAEHELACSRGGEALEQLFEQEGVDPFTLLRDCAVRHRLQ